MSQDRRCKPFTANAPVAVAETVDAYADVYVDWEDDDRCADDFPPDEEFEARAERRREAYDDAVCDRMFAEDMADARADREADDARKVASGACERCTGFHPPSQPCDDGGNTLLGEALRAALIGNRDKR